MVVPRGRIHAVIGSVIDDEAFVLQCVEENIMHVYTYVSVLKIK